MSFLRERPVDALTTEMMRRRHLRRVLEIEEAVYPRPWTSRTFVSELAQMKAGNRYYLVAYVGDVMAGYAGLMFSGDDAHVTNIAVDPAFQGRGVATEMMLDLSILAHDRGCTAMTLEVRHTNTAAQNLYRRFGFVPAGVRKRYYENTDDAIIMWAHGVETPEFMERIRLIESRRS
ncbi:MAG: ribosomal-protein-alanine acetyltransferase [Actinomycetota bacterium]|jgi:ribosomal-protein-alanine N-acetyltransferase